jgi:hypothetical protein
MYQGFIKRQLVKQFAHLSEAITNWCCVVSMTTSSTAPPDTTHSQGKGILSKPYDYGSSDCFICTAVLSLRCTASPFPVGHGI